MTPFDAREILDQTHTRGQDFHALTTDQVESLIERADAWGYRKPKNANGSRARYFHAMLTRRAAQ